ncbi:MAG: glycosyltransferase family 2 protein, partial [Chlamydiota bacterium]
MVQTLTIAIPTYNRAAFLIETLESIIPQMTSRVDLVISDNGSQDNTIEVVAKYQSLYPRIKLCRFSHNQGIDANIVNCLNNAFGDYVFFFSDDDLLMPESIKVILDTIDFYKPTMICLNHFCFKNHCLASRFSSFLPSENQIFAEGELFFKFCGLGFLSSLILDRMKALPETLFVKYGKECAHLDIGARIALKYKGPFVFLGKVSVAGRSLVSPRYHALDSCILFPKGFYEDLAEENLLTKEGFCFFINKLLYRDLPRVLAKMVLFSEVSPKKYKKILDESFGTYWIYKRFYRSIFFMDRKIIKPILHIAAGAVFVFRKTKFI